MNSKIFPVSMAVLWGLTFSTALHNWTIGICMGILMGSVFGLFEGEE